MAWYQCFPCPHLDLKSGTAPLASWTLVILDFNTLKFDIKLLGREKKKTIKCILHYKTVQNKLPSYVYSPKRIVKLIINILII